MAGGVIAAIYIGARSWKASRQGIARRYGKVPYGLAIVAGAYFLFGIQLSERAPISVDDQIKAIAARPLR
jgi:hypothetical protein